MDKVDEKEKSVAVIMPMLMQRRQLSELSNLYVTNIYSLASVYYK
jgi:hypothetical protein